MHHHGQIRRGLVDRHAEALHLGGQGRHGTCHAVLYLHLGIVQIRAEREGDGQGQLAVGGGLGRHIKHALDASDGLFQRRGDGFANHLGVGAGEVGAHHDGRWNHFRVFANR